ncbi:MAG: hypothetical protein QOG13_1532 [Sphingomonadales bacterium]|nr:hypothetical protein [Sphingomonadales bacterium]
MLGRANRMMPLLAAAALCGTARAETAPAPIPPAVRPIVRPTADAFWFDIVARDGTTRRYDGRWCVPTGYRLLGGGRFLGISSRGGELCGYVVIDRDAPDAGDLLTGGEPVFSPDGRYFVAAANVGRSDVDGVALWEVRRDEIVRRFASASLAGTDVRVDSWRGSACVALSAPGRADGRRRLYELNVGRRVALQATPRRRPCAHQGT